MKIIPQRIYGKWETNKMFFEFYPNGICKLKWKGNNEEDATYSLVNNKLIIKHGKNYETTWIAEIVYLYKRTLRTLDINGADIGVVETYKKAQKIEIPKDEIRWYHDYIGIPKENLKEFLFEHILFLIGVVFLSILFLSPIIILIIYILSFFN